MNSIINELSDAGKYSIMDSYIQNHKKFVSFGDKDNLYFLKDYKLINKVSKMPSMEISFVGKAYNMINYLYGELGLTFKGTYDELEKKWEELYN